MYNEHENCSRLDCLQIDNVLQYIFEGVTEEYTSVNCLFAISDSGSEYIARFTIKVIWSMITYMHLRFCEKS